MALNPFVDNGRRSNGPVPNDPPPPYESIMEGHSAFSAQSPSGSHTGYTKKDFEITVSNPVKQGDGVGAYVSYKVQTRTNLEQYTRPTTEVIRRFRDFCWLHDNLLDNNKGVIIPPLPEKNAVQKFQMATDFIDQRRRALQVFLNRVAAHPLLKFSKELQTFLEAPEQEWALVQSSGFSQSSGTKKRLNSTLGWFKDLGHSASQMVSGKAEEGLEDLDYLRVKEYIGNLELHLSEAHRHASRLVRKEQELYFATSEVGQALSRVGRLEQGPLAEAMILLGGRAQQLSAAARERMEQLMVGFEAPLKEFMRLSKSVQWVMVDRSAALAHLTHCRHDVDVKKVRLNKLRATPGGREDKVSEAERDLAAAELSVREAKIAYEAIVSRMTEELNGFQKERAVEMNSVLREFALTQACWAADQACSWSAFLQDLRSTGMG